MTVELVKEYQGQGRKTGKHSCCLSMLMAQTPEWKQLHQQLSGRLNSGDMAAVW